MERHKTVLELRNVSSSYGKVKMLQEVSLQVEEGEMSFTSHSVMDFSLAD